MRFSLLRRGWCDDRVLTAIVPLQGADDELDQAAQLKELDVQPAAASARYLGKKSTQMEPDILQDKARGNQQEAVSPVRRSCPAAYLAGTSITAFNAEAAAVLAPRLAWGPLQLDKNEDHPVGFALATSCSFGGGEHPADGQLSGEGRRVGAVEGALGVVTVTALAQGAGSAGLAMGAWTAWIIPALSDELGLG